MVVSFKKTTLQKKENVVTVEEELDGINLDDMQTFI